MKILTSKAHHEFLAFLPEIKFAISEWQLVTIKMEAMPDDTFTIHKAAELIHSLFEKKDGRIYVCNDHELLMVIHEGKTADAIAMAKQVKSVLPEGHCEISVDKPTAENFARFKISVKFDQPEKLSEFALKRCARTENIILIADDDMYMRILIKKGINPGYTVQEVIHGAEIVAAYKKYVPDILFLDIHMPGKGGMENLEAVRTFDPQAYIIMLSSDSSPENVVWTTKHGAKGFLAKPFAKDKLQEYIKKCPTIS